MTCTENQTMLRNITHVINKRNEETSLCLGVTSAWSPGISSMIDRLSDMTENV